MFFVGPVEGRFRAETTVVGDGEDGELLGVAFFNTPVKFINAECVDVIEEVLFVMGIQDL